jgi:type II secretory pathway component PulJ
MIETYLAIIIPVGLLFLAGLVAYVFYSAIQQSKSHARHRSELADELADKGSRLKDWQADNRNGVGR